MQMQGNVFPYDVIFVGTFAFAPDVVAFADRSWKDRQRRAAAKKANPQLMLAFLCTHYERGASGAQIAMPPQYQNSDRV